MHSYRNRPAMDDLPADVIAEPSELLNVWHLHRILALKARQLVEAAGGAADEVRVAIVGTGYTAHKALCLGLATDEPIIAQVDSCNLLEPDHTPIEELDHPGSPGHGTRVLSVLCGTFIGVVQGLRPIVYRAIDTPLMTLASSSTVAAAVKHAVQHNGCEIVLLTCGDPKQASIELADQIDSAYNNGVVIVAPAGELTTTVAFPARHSRPITVSGSTGLDLPWTAAGRGLAVDLCAPACDIIRADMLLQAGRPQPVYRAEGDGTAYAAAQVAAAAALWVAYRRQEIAAYARTWRLVEALRHCLAASAIRPPRWNERLWGAGILNIFALLGTPIPASDRLAERPSCALEKL
jgi:subtilisin family serine protease